MDYPMIGLLVAFFLWVLFMVLFMLITIRHRWGYNDG